MGAHPDEWERTFNLARRAFHAGRPVREAEVFLRALTEEQVNSPAGISLRLEWAFITGDLDEVLRLDQRTSEPTGPLQQIAAAFVYAARSDRTATQASLPQRAELLTKIEQQPENDFLLMFLATIEALSGNREEALRRADQAARLRPESADAWAGVHRRTRFAAVQAWTGDKDRAIDELTRLLRVPGSGLNIHQMKHAPNFAPLRGDPRFEALLKDPQNNVPLF